ncbi:tripartite-type tricarboxylate transporter receptor subunit TctC [Lipingzhangella halophila]|uniref:Tripartite-type tricarboxylate transporter receptor subunit TctC n=1 Tax=Lipingzhangella halophila TaxID=1783352 RepID=A0A7W7W210_9ACTN|nr:tripartite tricarboxylate transporter substrate binding protein [Lipingzhangella halophila]MBB4930898.1 tripartite-type tricarboxylate transporter receptor subunit TctC [Lipingzhangella halophila]
MRNADRFVTLGAAVVLLAPLAACSDAGLVAEDADDFPSEEMRMIIPYAPGGLTDTAGRALAEFYEKELDQTVVVENLPGGSSSVGMTELLTSDPDGHTIAMGTVGSFALTPQLQDLDYNHENVAYVGLAARAPGVLAVNADSEYETAEDFFEAAEDDPGALNVAVPGASTPTAMELRRMSDDHGVELTAVPFDGDAEAAGELLGGNVDALSDPLTDVIRQPIEEGDLRALAVIDEERSDLLPDTPTLEELGYDGLTLGISTWGPVVHADTPPEITEKLETSLEAAYDDPEFREQIGEEYIPKEFIDGADYQEQVEEAADIYAPMVD